MAEIKGDLNVKRRVSSETSIQIPAWQAGIDYLVGDKVTESGVEYRCVSAHTSATFASELANWSTTVDLETTQTWSTVQESLWVTTAAEGQINLAGSPTQKTTLTGNVQASTTGTVPANTSRLIRLEVTPGAFNFTLPAAWDPNSAYAQPASSVFVVAVEILSDGTPRFAKVI